MKILNLLIVAILLSLPTVLLAQSEHTSRVVYTGIYNQVPDNFAYPLIGFINHAQGNHKGAQVGFLNMNEQDFKGSQISFVNTNGGSLDGTQIGFSNTNVDQIHGVQTGFINTTAKNLIGTQIGFVNTAVKSSDGAQIGFVNTAGEDLKGTQIGFVNISPKEVTGAQIAFVNIVKKLNSVQIGFLNYTDSIGPSAVPIGFLSIIRKGGYKALEIGFTETHPINVAFKIGVPKFYTTLNTAFNPDFKNAFALGGGFGSVMGLGPILYFNPEVYYINHIGSNKDMARLNLNFGFTLGQKIDLIVGPSVVWSGTNRPNDFVEPIFNIYKENIDYRNELLLGLNAALRYNISY
ncbi:hypothetical protein KZP23_16945 [Echinicola marina]|uniref:LA_2272 family surface repeat-containing protein n=1 Tax=Echinicola marina TaxID=2859768 RepID=UPI001CF6A67E|nr:hypothetical protein [Echinicola marina]UCS92375.1 hypothetical protein KZP23_16945 [Echinicola marina]